MLSRQLPSIMLSFSSSLEAKQRMWIQQTALQRDSICQNVGDAPLGRELTGEGWP